MDSIFGFPLEDLYWRLKAGRSIKKTSSLELRANLNGYIKTPVFFLSTGRCGTKWISELLSYRKDLLVLHSPKPALDIQGKSVYKALKKMSLTEEEKDLSFEVFFAGREQFLRYAYKTGKRYFETNNYITFFAPLLAELFPDAKFVHMYRHPGEFIRSGIRRNYYTENNSDDLKRIEMNEKEIWNNYERIEKIAWLWNETNMFIEDFKMSNKENVFSFNFNNLDQNNVSELFKFLEIAVPEKEISKMLGQKVNTQKSGSFKKYDDWDETEKEKVRKICAQLSDLYQYEL